MLKTKKSSQRGFNQIDWLKSFHSFSFGNYFDPDNVNYSHLRVINEDWIAPRRGFGFHPHKDMEIITFMLKGNIEHRDNLGNVGQLKEGKVQLMRAGTGIVHSEMNNFDKEAHLLQIWITPEQKNLRPGWWEKEFDTQSDLEMIVSPIYPSFSLNIDHIDQMMSKSLKMAQQGYLIKSKNVQTFDIENKSVYIHAMGKTKIEYDGQNYHLDNGDAIEGRVNGKFLIDSQENTLVFIFDK